MQLFFWAKKWGISDDAIDDLKKIIGVSNIAHRNSYNVQTRETDIINLVRLNAAENGTHLWRNNVGAAYTDNGRFIRYGLANDSAKLNEVIKSGDLIGIRPVTITTKMIGATIGQFISREVKHANWSYTGNAREKAQLAWAELILSLGGDACFINRI